VLFQALEARKDGWVFLGLCFFRAECVVGQGVQANCLRLLGGEILWEDRTGIGGRQLKSCSTFSSLHYHLRATALDRRSCGGRHCWGFVAVKKPGHRNSLLSLSHTAYRLPNEDVYNTNMCRSDVRGEVGSVGRF
jgi:hypothetical protein